NQVQQSLRWFVDNFSSIADWRATLLRVASFRKAIVPMDELGQTASRISFAETEGPTNVIPRAAANPDLLAAGGQHAGLERSGRRVAEVRPSRGAWRRDVGGDDGTRRANGHGHAEAGARVKGLAGTVNWSA